MIPENSQPAFTITSPTKTTFFSNSTPSYIPLSAYPPENVNNAGSGIKSPNERRDALTIFESNLYRKLSSPVIEISRTIQFSFMDVFICFVGLAIMGTAGSLFILSATQPKDNTSTDNGYQIYIAGSTANPCISANVFEAHKPFRFRIEPDTEYLVCTWPASNTGARMIISFLSFFLPILWPFSIFNKENEKWIRWVFCGISVVSSLSFFLMMCVDADLVRESQAWCEGGLADTQLYGVTTKSIECGYDPFITICLLDAVLCIVWGFSAFLSLRFMLLGNGQTEETEDFSPQDELPLT